MGEVTGLLDLLTRYGTTGALVLFVVGLHLGYWVSRAHHQEVVASLRDRLADCRAAGAALAQERDELDARLQRQVALLERAVELLGGRRSDGAT